MYFLCTKFTVSALLSIFKYLFWPNAVNLFTFYYLGL